MLQRCWHIWPDRGFLINPDPLSTLSQSPEISHFLPSTSISLLESIATDLPMLLQTSTVRKVLDDLPIFDLSKLCQQGDTLDGRVIERLMLIYSYLASAYVHTPNLPMAQHIPAGVAVPLYALAQTVERPPILSYASYVLNNWQRINPEGPIELENLRVLQGFLAGRDERWFILVHVAIEACAARVLGGIQKALIALRQEDKNQLEEALREIEQGLKSMVTTFQRMPEQCDPDVYYYQVRPYIFGFTDVVYQGVSEEPLSFRGQTGAQSSIIPSLVALLGLTHEQSELTHHLEIMKAYMPRAHREFLAGITHSPLRAFVQSRAFQMPTLRDAYNNCLHQLIEFRRQHLYFATRYIHEKVSNPVGTGGTIYMPWLSKLHKETKEQMLT